MTYVKLLQNQQNGIITEQYQTRHFWNLPWQFRRTHLPDMCSQTKNNGMHILFTTQINAISFTKLYAKFSQIEEERKVVNYSEYFCDDHEKFCLKANNFDIRQIKNTNPTSLTVDLLRIKGKCSRNKLTELVPETLFLALLNYIPISLLKRNQMQT